MSKEIEIWVNINLEDIKVGILYIDNIKGKEIYSFKYDDSYLRNKYNYIIDPSLSYTGERQYSNNQTLFGFLQDIIPDRWGKTLLFRKYKRVLTTSDFLTLIDDKGRMGAIRVKNDGEFVNTSSNIPAYIYLNSLENAAYKIEDELEDDIKLLVEPGSSIGGARPKANVYDNDGNMFIAKFPSKNDIYDVELFECVVNDLATLCQIEVPEHKLIKLSDKGHTFLTKRFDREKERRFPYTSMMSMLGASDGDSSSYSYLDLVDILSTYSKNPEKDIIELYKRLVFNVIIHNSDDHLRNHGLVMKDNGYVLAPCFDINPTFYNSSLTLSIDGKTFEFDLTSVKKASKYFYISENDANNIIENMKATIKNSYEIIMKKYHASSKDISLFRNLIVENASNN